MNELVFPMTVTLILYAVLVPALTVLARLALEYGRDSSLHPHRAGSWTVLALIVSPLVLPTAAILGAAVHRIDGHHAYEVCVALHHSAESCDEAVLLVFLVALPLVVSLVRRLGRARKAGVRDLAYERFCGVEVRRVEGLDICARGLLRPWIEVGESALQKLSRDQIEAALLHEAEHARARDPLVSTIGRAALAVNPLGFLLEAWFRRWRLGREIRCDLRAVELGGNRFALAESLVAIARTQSAGRVGVSRLTGAAASLHLRVNILVGRELPRVPGDHRVLAVALGAAVFAALAIGYLDMPFIDAVHYQCERLFHGIFS